MKTRLFLLATALSFFTFTANLHAQGTAFTYQGQLNDGTNLASGLYDLKFSLYNASTNGTLIGSPLTNSPTPVTNGFFTVTLDFGTVFDGASYWLQMGVCTNGATNFTTLIPRQELTPNPYAIFAEGGNAAGLTGTLPKASLSGVYGDAINLTNTSNSFAGSGAGLTNVSATTLGGLSGAAFWKTNGNAGANPTNGAFLGTTDNNPLEIHVDGTRGLRVEPDSRGDGVPTLIGGYVSNAVFQPGSGGDFIGGGGYATIPNLIYSNSSGVFIGAGSANQVGPNVNDAVITGGFGNTIQSPDSIVGGGVGNMVAVSAQYSVVGGGQSNVASNFGSFIGGGGADGTTVQGNNASGAVSAIGGGIGNTNSGYAATIAGGQLNVSSAIASTVGGGSLNMATSSYATVAGGSGNSATYQAAVGGGAGNNAGGFNSTVGGGFDNAAGGQYSAVPGGNANSAGGYASFAAGQYAQTTQNNTFIWADGSQDPFTGANAANAFDVLASGGVFFYNGSNGVSVDHSDLNDGTLYYGLRFGETSGEGMASKRTMGGNQDGLDFYTGFNDVMSIAHNGFVGINTTSPSQRLEVNGNYVLIDGGNSADGNGSIDAYIGGSGSGSDVQIGSLNSSITSVGFWNNTANAWMHIACSSITINGGSDLAEPFEISTANAEMPPGSVVVIDPDHPGELKLSSQPYDTCVAGVLSGANGINPGIQMQQQSLQKGGKNVALTGRVYVQADASNGAIKPGNLLTTSSTPGRAMKVTDHAKAQGAILGKAMTGLSEGQGMVLVLVSLQ
jgi:hypothetical protein